MMFLAGGFCRQAVAEDLPQPRGPVLLTVSGSIGKTNAEGAAKFDRKMLEDMGLSAFETTTAWYEGVVHFEGVLVRDLLAAVDAAGDVARARALNAYNVEIPVGDFLTYDVLLALKMNGSYMTMRDKGPHWVVYPQSAHPELDRPEFHQRWIWQLESIEVR